jgi:HK97 family phage major capsid protein
VSSINLPKVSSGTTVGVQATQNSAVSDTAMTTTSVSSGITTISGKQIISMQLIQQSGIPFDQVILEDLALAYATQVDQQVLYGSNASGQVRGLVGAATNTAFTTASPAPASVTNANSLYYTVQKSAAAVQRGRFLPADAVIMSPERWAWVLGSVDANARPFVIPDGNNFNPVGTAGSPVAQGLAGHFGAYPVYTDPTISLTANSATNQDEIYVVRRGDLRLWESPVQSASFDATYADNASVLYRVLGYMAFICNRYAASVQSIRGTGLVLP